MKFGQMSIKGLSPKADYLQLDICGLTAEQAVNRFLSYKTEIDVVLHGDWTKKGASENNIEARLKEYTDAIQRLQSLTQVRGFTMHPPFRHKVSYQTFLDCCNELSARTQVSIWKENRSNSKIWLSRPEEIIEQSHHETMTIDIAQLYISCGYNAELLADTLSKLNWSRIAEIHLSNVKRLDKNTLVARKLEDGEIPMDDIWKHIAKVQHITLEILGGIPTFESQVEIVKTSTSSQ